MKIMRNINDQMIDRALEIDQMRFIDEIEKHIEKVKEELAYFELDLKCLYFK